MATSQMSEVVRHLRKAVLRCDGAETTDGQLLEAFLSQRDGAALGTLVRRHGPMVWAVCRRLLGNYHDAEDAFQATFLVLVRRAASVVPREMVANWLYGVAYQTARKARATNARRQIKERQVVEMPEPEAGGRATALDLRPLLDEELSRLPAKYRAAIVLCDLEGKTRREAARLLGVPEGTLSGRLTRGRALLAKRLVRQGLGMAGASAAILASQSCATASVPPAVLASTIKAATLLATGKMATAGVISPQVNVLVRGVLRTMLLKKIKIAMSVVLAVLFLGAGIGLLPHGFSAAGQADSSLTLAQEKSKTPEANPSKRSRPPAIHLKEVTLDEIDSAAGTLSVTVGSKTTIKLNFELPDLKIDGVPMKVKIGPVEAQLSNKLPRLLDLPVAKDVRIVSGDTTGTLSDLKAGMRASLDLGERDDQLTVIAISIKK